MLKFIYSEKATKFCEIFPLLLTTVHTVESKGKISQNFVAFSEYMNFNKGGLISESFSFWLHIQKNVSNHYPEHLKRICFGTLFLEMKPY